MSLNLHTIVGSLGDDPKIHEMQSGKKVCNLSVATSDSWKDKDTGERKERTQWHQVVTFNQGTIKYIEKACRKGSLVTIVGNVQSRKWTDKDGGTRYSTETIIPQFGGHFSAESPRGRSEDQEGDYSGTGEGEEPKAAERFIAEESDSLDDEIPF